MREVYGHGIGLARVEEGSGNGEGASYDIHLVFGNKAVYWGDEADMPQRVFVTQRSESIRVLQNRLITTREALMHS